MNIFERIEETAREDPGSLAFSFPDGKLTYGELWKWSGSIAAWVRDLSLLPRQPISVYGQKCLDTGLFSGLCQGGASLFPSESGLVVMSPRFSMRHDWNSTLQPAIIRMITITSQQAAVVTRIGILQVTPNAVSPRKGGSVGN